MDNLAGLTSPVRLVPTWTLIAALNGASRLFSDVRLLSRKRNHGGQEMAAQWIRWIIRLVVVMAVIAALVLPLALPELTTAVVTGIWKVIPSLSLPVIIVLVVEAAVLLLAAIWWVWLKAACPVLGGSVEGRKDAERATRCIECYFLTRSE
jgi:hypothetical protein